MTDEDKVEALMQLTPVEALDTFNRHQVNCGPCHKSVCGGCASLGTYNPGRCPIGDVPYRVAARAGLIG